MKATHTRTYCGLKRPQGLLPSEPQSHHHGNIVLAGGRASGFGSRRGSRGFERRREVWRKRVIQTGWRGGAARASLTFDLPGSPMCSSTQFMAGSTPAGGSELTLQHLPPPPPPPPPPRPSVDAAASLDCGCGTQPSCSPQRRTPWRPAASPHPRPAPPL